MAPLQLTRSNKTGGALEYFYWRFRTNNRCYEAILLAWDIRICEFYIRLDACVAFVKRIQ